MAGARNARGRRRSQYRALGHRRPCPCPCTRPPHGDSVEIPAIQLNVLKAALGLLIGLIPVLLGVILNEAAAAAARMCLLGALDAARAVRLWLWRVGTLGQVLGGLEYVVRLPRTTARVGEAARRHLRCWHVRRVQRLTRRR